MRRDAYRILQATETLIHLLGGFLIAIGAVFLLASTFWDGVRAFWEGRYAVAAVGFLDRILLALMRAEILYTLARFAREGGLQAEPFLLDVLAELFVLAVTVLAFAWAIRLVRIRA